VPDASPDEAPTNLTATVLSTSQIKLAWSEAVSNETGFAIERCAGSTCTNFVQVGTVSTGVKTFTSTGLASRTAYRFRVRAYNGGGYSFYTNISAATTK
jgi:hypothetical protein